MNKEIYICPDSMLGIFSAFYDAWQNSRNNDVEIELLGHVEQQLFCQYFEVKVCSRLNLRETG